MQKKQIMQDMAKKILRKVVAGAKQNSEKRVMLSIPKKHHYHVFWLRILKIKTINQKDLVMLQYLKIE